MSEILNFKPGEPVSPAVLKGVAVAFPEGDQPSFRKHLYPEGKKAELHGRLGVADGEEVPKAGTRLPLSRMTGSATFEKSGLSNTSHKRGDLSDIPLQAQPVLDEGAPPALLDRTHFPHGAEDAKKLVSQSRMSADGDADTEGDQHAAAATWFAPLQSRLAANGVSVFEHAGSKSAPKYGPAHGTDAEAAELTLEKVAKEVASVAGVLGQADKIVGHSGKREPSTTPRHAPGRDGFLMGDSAVLKANPFLEKGLQNASSVAKAQEARKAEIGEGKLALSAILGFGVGRDLHVASPPRVMASATPTPRAEPRISDLQLTGTSPVMSEAKTSARLGPEHPQVRFGMADQATVVPVQMPLSSPVPGLALQAFYTSIRDPAPSDAMISGLTREGSEEGGGGIYDTRGDRRRCAFTPSLAHRAAAGAIDLGANAWGN